MQLSHLSLINFRNFVRLDLDLPGHVTLLQGDNAQGKTNLLEAIYYLATTRSPQARHDRELINWLAEDEDIPFARLEAEVQKKEAALRLEIAIVKPAPSGLNTNTTGLRKTIKINGAPRRAMDLIGQLNVVLFLPQDIDLIGGSPSLRRRYLDITLCQIDSRYCRTLQTYNRILTQRNHLLRQFRQRAYDRHQLAYWDEGLVEKGSHIIARRQEVIAQLNERAQEVHLELTGRSERLQLNYQPSVNLERAPKRGYQMPLAWEQRRDAGRESPQIAATFAEQLAEIRGRELQAGMSLLGPHRDDLHFLVNGVDMNTYGSRGQQRTIALSLKLGELGFMRAETGEQPLLLLDDVMSELDGPRRGYLMNTVAQAEQVVVTTTDLTVFPPQFLARANLLRVVAGRIEKAS